MFFITHTEAGDNGTAIVDIDGPLNSETSSDFEEYTSKLTDSGIVNLLINSSKINFISSEGIGAVLLLHRKVSAINGVIVFFNLGREISLLFQLLGFDAIIDIVPDQEAAIKFAGEKDSGAGRENARASANVGKINNKAAEKMGTTQPVNLTSQPDGDHAAIRPFVIECVKCSSPVRVSMKGEHYCPYCSAPFTVSGDGNAIFRLRDIPSRGD